MTNQQIKATIAALLEERRGYEVRLTLAEGDTAETLRNRIADVNVSLAALGYKEPAAKKPNSKDSAKS